MKIKDIIQESVGELSDHQRRATRGLNRFADGKKWNSDYTLYRLGLALAATDGKTMPDVDQEMLKLAYKAVHANHEDMNHGDLRSQEGPTVHKNSPVAKPKKNRYGV
jgi:hypothetical protein